MRYFTPPEKDEEGVRWYRPPLDFFDHLDIALGHSRPEFHATDMSGPRILVADLDTQVDDSDDEEWVTYDAVTKLPYNDGQVAEIACYNVLGRLTADEIYGLLTEFERVLMDGGTLTIVVPAQGDPGTFGRTWFTTQTWPALIDREDGWAFSIGLNLVIGYSEQSAYIYTQMVRNKR